MTRARRTGLTILMALGLTLATAGCRIPLGNGCEALILEPGTQFGVSCNLI